MGLNYQKAHIKFEIDSVRTYMGNEDNLEIYKLSYLHSKNSTLPHINHTKGLKNWAPKEENLFCNLHFTRSRGTFLKKGCKRKLVDLFSHIAPIPRVSQWKRIIKPAALLSWKAGVHFKALNLANDSLRSYLYTLMQLTVKSRTPFFILPIWWNKIVNII